MEDEPYANVFLWLSQWCFTVTSPIAVQFVQNHEHISTIEYIYTIDIMTDRIHLIIPHEGAEKKVHALCTTNDLRQVECTRARVFLDLFATDDDVRWKTIAMNISARLVRTT